MKLKFTFLALFLSLLSTYAQNNNKAEYEKYFESILSESLEKYNRKELDSLSIIFSNIDTLNSSYKDNKSYSFKRKFIRSFIDVLENRYSIAFENLIECDRHFSLNKDNKMLALTAYQLGKTSFYMRNREKSRIYFEEALDLKKFLGTYYENKVRQYITTIDLEILQLNRQAYDFQNYRNAILSITKKYTTTLDYYQKNKHHQDYSQLSSLIAGCYSEIGDYQQALTILDKGDYHTQKSNNIESKAFALVKRSQTLNNLKQHRKALRNIQFAKTTYLNLNDLGMLIYAYVVEKDALIGLKKYKEANIISDSIYATTVKLYDTQFANQVAEFETKYKTEKKENELLKTRSDKALTELELSQQKQVTYGLIGGILLLVLITYSIVQRNKRRHQIAISEQKQQNLESIILAEEKERTRIARELHDGIVQQIGATILKSRNTFKKLGVFEKVESNELLADLEASSAELRSISHQMMPRALEEKGLLIALSELLTNSLSQLNINYSFEHFGIENRFDRKIEVSLYRITQELIQNIIKHSKATEVNLQLMHMNSQIIFLIEDNGVGLKSNQTNGIGLNNIRSRVDILEGSINFDSEGKGTLITIKIPL